MMVQSKNKQKSVFRLPSESGAGFTIVELVVVVAIIALFPLIVIPNFPQIKLQFALSRVSHKFAQDVRRAQSLTVSSTLYKDSLGNEQPINGYGIFVDVTGLGNKKYIIYADKDPGNQQYDLSDYIVETIDFGQDESGVVIQQINNVFGNKVSFNFAPPSPDTTIIQLNTSESSAEVVFALESDASKTRSVWINGAGLVEVK